MDVSMLTDDEVTRIEDACRRYIALDNVTPSHLTEMRAVGGDVEVRLFPMDEDGGASGPPASLYIEVYVDDMADWHEELGVYSADNLTNGGPLYRALDDELSAAIESATGATPSFVMSKGGSAFVAEVAV